MGVYFVNFVSEILSNFSVKIFILLTVRNQEYDFWSSCYKIYNLIARDSLWLDIHDNVKIIRLLMYKIKSKCVIVGVDLNLYTPLICWCWI